jgi:predicted SAM-dependent methyltransferase
MTTDTHEPTLTGEPKGAPKKAAYTIAKAFFGRRTLQLMWFDILRLKARLRHPRGHYLEPTYTKLHLGSGSRRVVGWLNVDVVGSDYNIDFTKSLPWKSGSFSSIVSQHVIEHLELFGELLPLLGELRRILQPGGELWVSCPDMEKICRLYVDGKAHELIEDKWSRKEYSTPGEEYSTHGAPAQQIVNDLFHQWGQHKNLFDFELIRWALDSAKFTNIRKIEEAQLLEHFPDFPARRDDKITLYVTAQAPKAA